MSLTSSSRARYSLGAWSIQINSNQLQSRNQQSNMAVQGFSDCQLKMALQKTRQQVYELLLDRAPHNSQLFYQNFALIAQKTLRYIARMLTLKMAVQALSFTEEMVDQLEISIKDYRARDIVFKDSCTVFAPIPTDDQQAKQQDQIYQFMNIRNRSLPSICHQNPQRERQRQQLNQFLVEMESGKQKKSNLGQHKSKLKVAKTATFNCLLAQIQQQTSSRNHRLSANICQPLLIMQEPEQLKQTQREVGTYKVIDIPEEPQPLPTQNHIKTTLQNNQLTLSKAFVQAQQQQLSIIVKENQLNLEQSQNNKEQPQIKVDQTQDKLTVVSKSSKKSLGKSSKLKRKNTGVSQKEKPKKRKQPAVSKKDVMTASESRNKIQTKITGMNINSKQIDYALAVERPREIESYQDVVIQKQQKGEKNRQKKTMKVQRYIRDENISIIRPQEADQQYNNLQTTDQQHNKQVQKESQEHLQDKKQLLEHQKQIIKQTKQSQKELVPLLKAESIKMSVHNMPESQSKAKQRVSIHSRHSLSLATTLIKRNSNDAKLSSSSKNVSLKSVDPSQQQHAKPNHKQSLMTKHDKQDAFKEIESNLASISSNPTSKRSFLKRTNTSEISLLQPVMKQIQSLSFHNQNQSRTSQTALKLLKSCKATDSSKQQKAQNYKSQLTQPKAQKERFDGIDLSKQQPRHSNRLQNIKNISEKTLQRANNQNACGQNLKCISRHRNSKLSNSHSLDRFDHLHSSTQQHRSLHKSIIPYGSGQSTKMNTASAIPIIQAAMRRKGKRHKMAQYLQLIETAHLKFCGEGCEHIRNLFKTEEGASMREERVIQQLGRLISKHP